MGIVSSLHQPLLCAASANHRVVAWWVFRRTGLRMPDYAFQSAPLLSYLLEALYFPDFPNTSKQRPLDIGSSPSCQAGGPRLLHGGVAVDHLAEESLGS